VVKIEETEPGTYTCRLSGGPEPALTPYEAQVLDLLRRRAVDGVVPARALTAGPADEARGWIAKFNRKVVEEADRAGLCGPRWPAGAVALMGVLAGIAFVVAAFSGRSEATLDLPQVIALAVSFVTLWVLSHAFRDDTQMVTPAGLAAQARWLALRRYLHDDEVFASLPPTAVAVRDRYIAYGAALGAATAAVRAMPMGAESDRWAWTRYGGQWRQVRVSYPNRWPPAYGYSPSRAAWLAIRVGGIGLFWFWLSRQLLPRLPPGTQTDQLGRALSTGVTLVNVAAFLAVVAAVWLLLAAGLALLGTTEVTGEAIRLRRMPGGRCYVAVYRGSGDHVRAWVISPEHYAAIDEYDTITVSVATLLGRVRSVRRSATPSINQPLPAGGGANP
jgi:hypothetical protein